jgi:hypothetical protein
MRNEAGMSFGFSKIELAVHAPIAGRGKFENRNWKMEARRNNSEPSFCFLFSLRKPGELMDSPARLKASEQMFDYWGKVEIDERSRNVL